MRHSPNEARLIKEHGDLGALLERLYVVERKSLRKIRPLLGLASSSQVGALLKRYGIKARTGSDAIRTQWENNPARRAAAGALFGSLAAARSARGQNPLKGRRKETNASVAASASALRERKWLSAPAVVEKATAARVATFQRSPERHANAKAIPTLCETAVIAHLAARGIAFAFQHPVRTEASVIFVDIVIAEIAIAIEVAHDYGRVPVDRLRFLRAAGLRPVCVHNRLARDGRFAAQLDQIIALAQLGEFDPTTVRECWVTSGRGKRSAALDAYFDQSII